jgi:hypothetical protein
LAGKIAAGETGPDPLTPAGLQTAC